MPFTLETTTFPHLDETCIHFIQVNSRNAALESIILSEKNPSFDAIAKPFLQAILAREELVSTGIGLGCAIPHAKLPEIEDFFLNIGIIQGPGVDWKSIDHIPVKLIFMIGGPANEPNRYLKILSSLTEAIRSEEFRREILTCQNAKDVLKLFERI